MTAYFFQSEGFEIKLIKKHKNTYNNLKARKYFAFPSFWHRGEKREEKGKSVVGNTYEFINEFKRNVKKFINSFIQL